MRFFQIHLISFLVSFNAFSEIIIIPPSENAQEQIQEAMILAKPGDEIQLTTGVYMIEDGLSMDIDGISLKGTGQRNTVLDFSNQMTGAQGLMVTSSDVLLQDFAIINTKGDAIKSKGSNGIAFINIRTEWTRGPNSMNGAYGLYPVDSKNVLIDGCIAIGASDAGIYVGQSQNIIVRNSLAEYNVAGIEIENSYYADVYNNTAQNNTGGILVFDLPDLPQQGGHHVRVFNNQIKNNNTDNFAPEGNIVGEVPRGTGIIVMANSDVEIFNNDIADNGTVNIAIVSFSDSNDQVLTEELDYEKGQDRYTNSQYYPHPKSVQVHDNSISNSGFNPDLDKEIAAVLYELSEGEMTDIFWDGVLPLTQMMFGQPDEDKLILNNNGDATFLTIRPIRYMFSLPNSISTDQTPYNHEVKPLQPVVINFSK